MSKVEEKKKGGERREITGRWPGRLAQVKTDRRRKQGKAAKQSKAKQGKAWKCWCVADHWHGSSWGKLAERRCLIGWRRY